ncbi:hypothetical protein PENTCL1PPCAC_24801, partial [Pristionchus entomophagus]
SMSGENLVIRWEVDEISKLSDEPRFSRYYHQSEIPWRLSVRTKASEQTKNVKHLSLHLRCNEESDSELWSCDHSSTLTLLHPTQPNKSLRLKGMKPFNKADHSFGETIIDFASLDFKGFVKDDKITVEARTAVTAVHCVRPKPKIDFTKPTPGADNVALKLDDGIVHVCRR